MDLDKIFEYHNDGFSISTDKDLLDIEMIYGFVSRSYWARGIPKDLMIKAIHNSFCFGLYHGQNQAGFARLITDFATEAEICEVFVLAPYQGRGLGTWLMECVITCPCLEGIRTLSLGTHNSHGFYEKVGFHIVGACPNQMQILYDRSWYVHKSTWQNQGFSEK